MSCVIYFKKKENTFTIYKVHMYTKNMRKCVIIRRERGNHNYFKDLVKD